MKIQTKIEALKAFNRLGDLLITQLEVLDQYQGKLSIETERALKAGIKTLTSKYAVSAANVNAIIKG